MAKSPDGRLDVNNFKGNFTKKGVRSHGHSAYVLFGRFNGRLVGTDDSNV